MILSSLDLSLIRQTTKNDLSIMKVRQAVTITTALTGLVASIFKSFIIQFVVLILFIFIPKLHIMSGLIQTYFFQFIIP